MTKILELNEKQFKRVRILIDDYVNLRINSRCQDREEIENLNKQIAGEVKRGFTKEKLVQKPFIYIQREGLRALQGLSDLKEYIKNSKRITKTETSELISSIKEPLMRTVGYIFPDEEHPE